MLTALGVLKVVTADQLWRLLRPAARENKFARAAPNDLQSAKLVHSEGRTSAGHKTWGLTTQGRDSAQQVMPCGREVGNIARGAGRFGAPHAMAVNETILAFITGGTDPDPGPGIGTVLSWTTEVVHEERRAQADAVLRAPEAGCRCPWWRSTARPRPRTSWLRSSISLAMGTFGHDRARAGWMPGSGGAGHTYEEVLARETEPPGSGCSRNAVSVGKWWRKSVGPACLVHRSREGAAADSSWGRGDADVRRGLHGSEGSVSSRRSTPDSSRSEARCSGLTRYRIEGGGRRSPSATRAEARMGLGRY
ncbi:replication-relaxation family protein [Streptacidiphilus sp. MAP12-16]|uniref:replication-relaxation family protein n=1 Tax=Streptacidiphilus sp. MAP12-16 TaxID=3156300 RepID=UPI003511D622